MEIWNEELTDKSWSLLIELHRKYDFVLIGGWAIYMYTKSMKSKDVDFVVSISELEKMRGALNLYKNERLKKYEYKVGLIDVDIYVPYWSKLAVPPEDIIKDYLTLEGFKVVTPEKLIILKVDAEMDRKYSEKGLKDRMDLISLLLSDMLDWDKLAEEIMKYGKKNYVEELIRVVKNAKDEFRYLNINNPRQVKKIKEDLEGNIKALKSQVQRIS